MSLLSFFIVFNKKIQEDFLHKRLNSLHKIISSKGVLFYENRRDEYLDLLKQGNYIELLSLINLTLLNLNDINQKNPLIDELFYAGLSNIFLHHFEQAVMYIQKSTYILNSYHCYYHYLSADIYHNMRFIAKTLKDEILFTECNEKCEFLCKFKDFDNNLIPDLTQSMINANIQSRNIMIFDNNTHINDLKKAIDLSGSNSCNDSLAMYKKIINILNQQHFEYHCILALHFFVLGNCYDLQNDSHTAQYYYEKALEQDKNNPLNNIILQNYICK